jgi:hypothetical protein
VEQIMNKAKTIGAWAVTILPAVILTVLLAIIIKAAVKTLLGFWAKLN